ncbi:DUF4097 family beta strand repeat-containing protein [Methanocella sp. MCL-LM]|uniref:DUF4097 family beta strand repeat-containing protein n=1 Tax=Methanocella sp. MCL-LM TaxID=3412035 RepID=UPI003C780994
MIDKIIVAILAIIAILVLLFAGIGFCGLCMFVNNVENNTGFNGLVEHREDKTIHAPAQKVSIEGYTLGGDVEVSESTTGNIEVIYDVYAPQGHLDDIVTGTNYSMEGDTLKIKATAKFPDNMGSLSMVGTRGANLHIKVPKNATYDLNLNTLGGRVIVPDLQGSNLKISTMGGDIDLDNVSYDSITATTAGGDITAEYDAGKAVFETMGGRIVLNTKQATGTMNASTAGGDIRVTLPDDTRFTIDASTMGGRVTHGSINMADAAEKSKTRLSGSTEGGVGSLDIDLKTMGGDIEISY